MQDHTYSIIMNSILQASADRVNLIKRNMARYKFKVNLEKLGVGQYFQFNNAFREAIIRNEDLAFTENAEINVNEVIDGVDEATTIS